MGKLVMCPTCKGKGHIWTGGSLFKKKVQVACTVCGGSGKVRQN